ncbi:terminase large subunit [Rhodococcus sp. D2-41]|uniref:Terminase large subunit n=1 Tax=Speluncibacter jeojiensis TaxID=2710754 RepID=A0A9X4LZT2_9ACTN|nr:terminase TerL endonuclease subunit [Rhodococcus sp. D2-41]MDG3012385.1 terminase large subunit [Rhodococcus sp. D2-41]MDG3013557.1 terminase large subunit [Corynebacteriales bacterium D3-21]
MSEPPVCGRLLDGIECAERGEHFCVPRADHAQKFFEEILVHTKGQYARTRFELMDWQRDEIVRELFGQTVWSEEFEAYKRRYEIAWIELGRKNGKSELLAGIMLYLLVADAEESAEIYGVAKNRDQAGLVFEVAAQMVRLSPILSKRLKVINHKKRIVDERTHSFYQVIAADAGGALGSNPHGVGADEILAWHDGGMWDAMETGMGSGARRQPLMVAATTAGSDTEGFAGQMHNEMQRIQDDPSRSPHTFVYLRNTPRDADPWDEENWYHANPALGQFLSLEKLRAAAKDAQNNPIKENAFRQFRLNQWTSQAVRWMPMHLWDASKGDEYPTAQDARDAFTGRECWFGLDLAARQDLTAMCFLFPGGDECDVLWRFWCPESALEKLNTRNSGRFTKFVKDGWLTVTEGDVLDFQKVYADIEADALRFTVLGGDADKWSSDPVIQEVQDRTDIQEVFAYQNDFTHMSDGMHRILELVTEGKFRWHDNPVARFCFDAAEARIAPYNPDLIRPDKPNRNKAAKRIDAVPAAVMAVNAWITRGDDAYSTYEDGELLVL